MGLRDVPDMEPEIRAAPPGLPSPEPPMPPSAGFANDSLILNTL
jgi:hypothetical protein